MSATQIRHGLGGYKKEKCRCEVCRAAYEAYLARNRKHERVPRIDATPLIEFIIKRDEPLEGQMWKAIENWRVKGIDVHTADRHCVKRGFHPALVFGDAWYAIPFIEQLPEDWA